MQRNRAAERQLRSNTRFACAIVAQDSPDHTSLLRSNTGSNVTYYLLAGLNYFHGAGFCVAVQPTDNAAKRPLGTRGALTNGATEQAARQLASCVRRYAAVIQPEHTLWRFRRIISMKIVLAPLVVGSLIVGTALAQTSATSQSSAAASNDAPISAGNSGAQASSSASTNATLTKRGRQAGAAGSLQSGSAIGANAGNKSLTSSGNFTGAGSASAARSDRGLMGSAGASSAGTLNSAGRARGADMRSAAASGAHLNRDDGSAALSHDSQGSLAARRANLGSSTAGSGMLDTRGGNAHFNSAPGRLIKKNK
jgi:hypothetical protein